MTSGLVAAAAAASLALYVVALGTSSLLVLVGRLSFSPTADVPMRYHWLGYLKLRRDGIGDDRRGVYGTLWIVQHGLSSVAIYFKAIIVAVISLA